MRGTVESVDMKDFEEKRKLYAKYRFKLGEEEIVKRLGLSDREHELLKAEFDWASGESWVCKCGRRAVYHTVKGGVHVWECQECRKAEY